MTDVWTDEDDAAVAAESETFEGRLAAIRCRVDVMMIQLRRDFAALAARIRERLEP